MSEVAHNTLYRKYRSLDFKDVVGQGHITSILDNAIKTGKTSHAYLFSGPRGVGKTSVARIFAHKVNDLKYDEQVKHLDIIEIDAASNRRIDEIRDLREKVQLAPIQAKYKVYIIDEVHMLTKEAFNALLKTLEEPPSHVVFILATTELQMLPATIISRTQRHSFRRIGSKEIASFIKSIAKKEKIKLTDPAADLISEQSTGSMRDALSLLGQLNTINGEVTQEQVIDLLGIASGELVAGIIDKTFNKDLDKLNLLLEDANNRGVSAAKLADQLVHYLNRDVKNITAERINLAKQLLGVRAANDPGTILRVTLYSFAVVDHQPATLSTKESEESDPKPSVKVAALRQSTKLQKTKTAKKVINKPAKKAALLKSADGDWDSFMQVIKQQDKVLYTLLRMVQPEITKEHIELKCRFDLHLNKLQAGETNKKLQKYIKEHFSLNEIRYTLTQEAASMPASAEGNIMDIMGGGEVIKLGEAG